MQPVRVKIYGLVPRTRGRYLVESALAGLYALAILVAWWLGWPIVRGRLAQADLPPTMVVVVAILDQVPWILLVAGLVKVVEVYFVLRLFARKTALLTSPPEKAEPGPGGPPVS